jgi:hypothetical protein
LIGGEEDVATTSELGTLVEALAASVAYLEDEDRKRCSQWVRRAAARLMLRFDLNKPRPDMDTPPLPSRINARWRCEPSHSCNLGTAELALAWSAAFRQTGDLRMVNATLKALDQLKRQQDLASANDRLRGGIPRSRAAFSAPEALLLSSHATARLLEAIARQEAALEELERV